MAETPTPILVCRAEGHLAICPGCGQELKVRVIERKDPTKRFVLSRHLDGSENEITHGSAAEYDLSKYERHYQEQHGA